MFYFLVAVPVGLDDDALLAIDSTECTSAPAGVMLMSGFNVNGKALLSGTGSTDTTMVAPLRSVGNVTPAGAFCTKSSPGYAGPGLAPLYGAAASDPDTEVNVPVVTGVPSMTAQPSYAHPDGSAGSDRPASGVPELLSKNHTPLASLSAMSSVGVARMYDPEAEVRSVPSAALCDTVSGALSVLKSPAKICTALGAGSLSGLGSIVRMNAVALSRASLEISNVVCDGTPCELTVNIPVVCGAPSTIIHPSYAAVLPRSSRPERLSCSSCVLVLSSSPQEINVNANTAINSLKMFVIFSVF